MRRFHPRDGEEYRSEAALDEWVLAEETAEAGPSDPAESVTAIPVHHQPVVPGHHQQHPGGSPGFRLGAHVGHIVKNTAQKIAQAAYAKIGHKTREFFPANPRLACASFVSNILVHVGAIPAPRFTRSAAALVQVVRAQGAHPVLPARSMLGPATVTALRAGDVIIFASQHGQIHHAGIGLGPNRFVGTSSRGRIVKEWTLLKWNRIYPRIQYYRFPAGTRLVLERGHGGAGGKSRRVSGQPPLPGATSSHEERNH